MHLRASIVAAPLLAALLCLSPATHADELKDISQLVGQGQHALALDRVNSYLASRPKDVQGQFLKGVILAEQNKPLEAIRIFSTITEQHPELPEPYNNLAVLYADQGQYDKARKALEMAIRTHPSYATAHENLGDIYAKMASDAYDKALQLDKGNARAQTKLSMVKDIFSGNVKPSQSPVKPEEPAKPAAVQPAPPAEPVSKPAAKPTTPVAEPAAPAEPEKPAAAESKDPTPVLTETVQRWAKAWSSQNVDAYLAHYADGFKTPGGENRSAWEKSRRARIKAPASIDVDLSGIRVNVESDKRARVSFKQNYRAGNVAKRTAKTLVMKRSGDKWLIEQELTDR